jgi:hypothetical protein
MDASETFSSYAWRLMTVVILVFANGFFVAAEFALVGVRRSRIEALPLRAIKALGDCSVCLMISPAICRPRSA